MVVAVSMVKDEADIVEHTVRRMAGRVDALIVADNLSTDGTREILDELAHELPLTVIDDREPGYYQSAKMTALAERARENGATWIVPFDADEVWLPRQGATLSQLLDSFPPNVLIAEAPLFDHVATGIDPGIADPLARLGWRRAAAAPLRKIACRAIAGLTIHQGNHGVTIRGVPHPPAITTAIEIRHYPYRSVEQFVRKARNGSAAYAAADLPAAAGAHWRGYGRILERDGEAGIEEIFRKWFWRASPEDPIEIDGEHQHALVYDPAP